MRKRKKALRSMELSDFLGPDTLQYCSQTNEGTPNAAAGLTDQNLEKSILSAENSVCGALTSTARPDQQQEDDPLKTTANSAPSSLRACANSLPPNEPHPSAASRFAAPVSEDEILERRESSIPAKTAQDTRYCMNVSQQWSTNRNQSQSSQIPPLSTITPVEFQYWLIRFVLEVRKLDGTEYPPQTLHHLCSGLVRYLRLHGHPILDIFKNSLFAEFRSTLDAEMKRLQGKGIGSKKKQAEPLTEEEEEALWKNGLLGDHSPEALLNTMVYMIGLYFALRSGKEHRELQFHDSQIVLVQREGERSFLEYTEVGSKNHPGGLKGRYISRKIVRHHQNISNPTRCFIRLFNLYKSRCPPNPKRNAFYLKPLKKHVGTVWFSREPLGHNTLTKAVSSMCKAAGIKGFRSNHSLRATSATRLYAAGTDEQLIMERTGHRSVGGVRSYKRTSTLQEQGVSDILSRTPLQPPSQPVVTGTLSPPSASVSGNAIVTEGPTFTSGNISTSFSAMSMPSSFYFHSCNSVVININK